MARGINKVILVGNLGADPETRYLPNGNAVTNISVATSESWKDKESGQQQDRTEWHRVVLFGKLAEIAGEYARKGSQVYLEGKLQTRKWQGQDGQDRYTTEIVVDMQGKFQMLGGGKREDQDGGQQQEPQQQAPKPQRQRNPQAQPQQAKPQAQDYDSFDDDIPFMDPYRFAWRLV